MTWRQSGLRASAFKPVWLGLLAVVGALVVMLAVLRPFGPETTLIAEGGTETAVLPDGVFDGTPSPKSLSASAVPSVTATRPTVPLPTAERTSQGTTPSPDQRSTSSPAPVRAAPSPMVSEPAVSSRLLSALGWRVVQEAERGRITILDQRSAPPGQSTTGSVLRAELRNGDKVTTSGYTASRAEVYGRSPTDGWSSTPSDDWPDPPGSTRWYDFSLYVPADFPLATDSRWFTFTQWKGYRGGSPPIALEIKRNDFRLGGAHMARSLGQVKRGAWTRFTVGMHFSSDPKLGWVEVYRDGSTAVPRTSVATLDTVSGEVDPIYLKQGIYRSSVWTSTHVLYFSPMRVSGNNPLR